MSKFNFYFPLPIRYADLDAQWHVNNARYLTFLEQTRMEYFMNLGLFDGEDFFSLGFIVADIHIAYAAPIVLREKNPRRHARGAPGQQKLYRSRIRNRE
jgi:acyl-CoA thioester hydrolase